MKKFKPSEINNKGTIILFVTIIAGIILRFLFLEKQPLGAAEISSINFSLGQNIFTIIINNFANNTQPPLFNVLQYLWTLIFGLTESSVRFLPAVFGVVSVLIIQKLTRTFYSEKVSIIAASFFALNPYQIYFSQQALPATFVLMTSLMMIYYFMLSVKYNSFVSGPFTFWSIAALYSGHEALLLLLILNVILFIRYKEEIRINLWLRSQIFILIACIPLVPYLLRGVIFTAGGMKENIWMAPFISFKNFIMGYTLDFNFLTVIAVVAASLFLLIGVITYRKAKEKRMTDIMSYSILFMVLIPWIGAITGKAVYSDGFLLTAGAILVVLISIGVSHMSKEGLVLFTMVVIIMFAASLKNYYLQEQYAAVDMKKTYQQISENFKEGDIIIHNSPGTYGQLEFYNTKIYKKNIPDILAGSVSEYKGLKFVRDKWRNLKLFLASKINMDIYAGYDRNIATTEELKNFVKSAGRVWFISETPAGAKQRQLAAGYSYYIPLKSSAADLVYEMLLDKMRLESEAVSSQAVLKLLAKR